MFYTVKVPWLARKYFSELTWQINTSEKVLYLTFDDGPHPTATPFVLEQLAKHSAMATFFCIGNNVKKYPAIYQDILNAGHTTGNHTFNHVNGWKTADADYINNVELAEEWINSKIFRPPYGRITKFQSGILQEKKQFEIIMWTVLSGDFDIKLSPEKCLQHVVLNAKPGSIIVFHDSTKAFDRLKVALPGTLDFFSKQGYRFAAIQKKSQGKYPGRFES